MKEKNKIKYAKIVELLANFSEDERLKVGCLIIKEGRIVSTGYNGYLSGMEHKPILVDGHNISIVHAEINALLFCAKIGIPTKDCDIFISALPCNQCTKAILTSGIKKIYYLKNYKNQDNIYLDKIEVEQVII